jgi:uncharacterized protein
MSSVALGQSAANQETYSLTSYLDIAITPSVKAAQDANGSGDFMAAVRASGIRTFDRFTEAETQFISHRDSFYLATASESGWPYIQHRGGPAGFLRVLDSVTLGFSDFRGNRQYISVGNFTADDRVSLILTDYPNRRRLKIYAHAEERDLRMDSVLAGRLALPGYKARAERAVLLHLEAFDWNCSQHITPRFSATELDRALAPVRLRLEQFEAENKALLKKLARVDRE